MLKRCCVCRFVGLVAKQIAIIFAIVIFVIYLLWALYGPLSRSWDGQSLLTCYGRRPTAVAPNLSAGDSLK